MPLLSVAIVTLNEEETLARTLAEMPELAVVDEFTSVVDRTVAKIGSAAAKVSARIRAETRIISYVLNGALAL